jgi:hypothetical protein
MYSRMRGGNGCTLGNRGSAGVVCRSERMKILNPCRLDPCIIIPDYRTIDSQLSMLHAGRTGPGSGLNSHRTNGLMGKSFHISGRRAP